MSRYGYLEVFQCPLEFEITRVDCILGTHQKRHYLETKKKKAIQSTLVSRIPRGSLKYFEISVPRHVRFAELRENHRTTTLCNRQKVWLQVCVTPDKLKSLKSNIRKFELWWTDFMPLMVFWNCAGWFCLTWFDTSEHSKLIISDRLRSYFPGLPYLPGPSGKSNRTKVLRTFSRSSQCQKIKWNFVCCAFSLFRTNL